MSKKASSQQLSSNALQFHTFYQDVFGKARWNQLYAALIKPTDLVAVVNPYVPTRWIARELGQLNAKPSAAFNTLFTKKLLIYELPATFKAIQAAQHLTNTSTTANAIVSTESSLQDIEDKGFTSRWPVRLPKVGHQPGDNQLDVALATQDNVNSDDSDDNDENKVNTDEHIRLNGGFISGFGARRDKLGWYLMDLASIAAPLILNPQPGEKVLDLCAAPGGKSLILSYLIFFRNKLATRFDEIEQIMTRHAALNALEHNEHSSTTNGGAAKAPFTCFADEPCAEISLDDLMTDNNQDPAMFAHLEQTVPPSLRRFRKFEQRYIYEHNTTTTTSTTPDAQNDYAMLHHGDITAAHISYENDQILKAINISRHYHEKTQNELDREMFEKNVDPTSDKGLLTDLAHEREMRMLHSKIINPTTAHHAKHLSSTTDDTSDEELNAANAAADLAAVQQKRKNKKLRKLEGGAEYESDSDSDLSSFEVKRRRKLAKDKALKDKEEAGAEAAKLNHLRLKSRLVLNDVSVPRVKRLQKVVQSYLPVKYMPLIEVTNIDASTAQQFTLITRNSRGDVSVKKKVTKQNQNDKNGYITDTSNPPGEYDCVLVDAPCSSDRHIVHDNALANWSLQQTKDQAKRQFHLLLAAIRSLKIGGRCVYSTCSLSPFENDGVVQKVIKTLGEDVVKVVHFKLDIGEKTGVGWILLPDQPGCSWGPLYMSLLMRIK